MTWRTENCQTSFSGYSNRKKNWLLKKKCFKCLTVGSLFFSLSFVNYLTSLAIFHSSDYIALWYLAEKICQFLVEKVWLFSSILDHRADYQCLQHFDWWVVEMWKKVCHLLAGFLVPAVQENYMTKVMSGQQQPEMAQFSLYIWTGWSEPLIKSFWSDI